MDPRFVSDGVSFLSAGPSSSSAPRSVVWWCPRRPAPPHGAWPLRVAGDVVAGGDDEGNLSAVETLRRQRLRQRGAGISGYAAARDGRLFYVQHGDLYAAPARGAGDATAGAAQLIVAHGEVHARAGVAASAAPGPVFGFRVSPCARWVAFVLDQTLYVAPTAPGAGAAVRRVSPPGGGALAFGVPDYISEEEFARHDGLWWSPDSTRLLYQVTDESGVEEVDGEGFPLRQGDGAVATAAAALLQPLRERRTESAAPATTAAATAEHHRYPYAGARNPSLSFCVADVSALTGGAGGGTIAGDCAVPHLRLAVAGADADVYCPRVAWLPTGDGVLLQVLNRRQDCLDLVRFAVPAAASVPPLADGAVVPGELLLRERATAAGGGGWLNISDACMPLPRREYATREYFIWGSERTGHLHLYLYSVNCAADASAVTTAAAYAGPPATADDAGAAGAPSAVLERVITAGRWAVDDIVRAYVPPAPASTADALVFFHARAHGPTEVHLYAAPIFDWASPPPDTAAAGDAARLWPALGCELAEVAGTAAAACPPPPPPPPPLWFEAEAASLAPEALCARIIAARVYAAFAEFERFRALGMVRLTAGPGSHRCVVADDCSAFTDELSCMYEPRPSLTLHSLDVQRWAAARADGWRGLGGGDEAAGAEETEAARRLLLRAPPAVASAVAAAAAAVATAAAAAATAAGAEETKAVSSENAPGELAPAVGAAAAAAAAAGAATRDCCSAAGLFGALFQPAVTTPEVSGEIDAAGTAPGNGAARASSLARLLRRLVLYESAGRHSSSTGRRANAALAWHALGARAEGVLVGLLPHPYAPTVHFLRSVAALLGGGSGAESAAPLASAPSPPSPPSPPSSAAAAASLVTWVLRATAPWSPPRAAGAPEAAPLSADALALLFPADALPREPPLPGAAESRVALRRTPFPPQGCFTPTACAHAYPPPAVLVLDTAEAAGDAAARALLRRPFDDDAALMYAAVALPVGAAAAADGEAPPPSPPPPRAAAPFPTVLYVYGGPGVQIVSNSYGLLSGGNAHSTALCAAGVAVVRMDSRGSAHRGLAFERPVWRRLGDVEVEDQAAGLRQLVRAGLVDARRTGVHGWSYGGFMTLRLLAARLPFCAGVAGAPVTHWALYDTAYTERYMLRPGENAAGYASTGLFAAPAGAAGFAAAGGSPAERLVGLRFRVLHGDTDENVHAANSRCLEAAWADALRRRIESRQPSITRGYEHFDFLAGERHALSEAASETARAETVRFLLQHVAREPAAQPPTAATVRL